MRPAGPTHAEGVQPRRRSQPAPEALRAFAVRYVEHVRKTGGTMAQASERLGVSEPTLYAWAKRKPVGRPRAMAAQKSEALVPVRVGEGKAAAGAGLEGLQQKEGGPRPCSEGCSEERNPQRVGGDFSCSKQVGGRDLGVG
jgi:transposase